ncbi:hypothetical protein BDV32DRAFT_153297 [Aspergillus pseudonomiae]|nr:hypothetical protein BDV32DRAFT_153297 [Aspergillus pseudonomiae]
MLAHTKEPRAIIIGCGVAGIALSARLKKDLEFDNFIVYECERDVGGTWFLSTYPGVVLHPAAHSSSFELLKQPIESQEKAVGDCSASHAAGRFLIRQDETKQN